MTVSPAPIRRLPLPCCEPPYDDELPPSPGRRMADAWFADGRPPRSIGRPLAVQGTLALSFTLPSGLPAVPQPPPTLRLVAGGAPAGKPGKPGKDEFGPQPTGTAGLPAARSWAGRIVQAIVEVIAGVRPASQLVRWTTAEIYDDISRRVVPAPAGAPDRLPTRGVVSSVHVTEPADGVAEACALVRRGARSTAVAIRLEGMDGRWQCTALELG